MHAKANTELVIDLENVGTLLAEVGKLPPDKQADALFAILDNGLPDLVKLAADRLGIAAKMSAGAADVLFERDRQQEQERFSPEHDDQHRDRSLAYAASAYLGPVWRDGDKSGPPVQWGWGAEWWKPGGDDAGSERRRAVKGAALAIAEIDRLDRDAARRKVEG